MSFEPFQKTIETSKLLVDVQNPRFPDTLKEQNEAIREMIRTQGTKILALAQHLALNGRNPANLLIVIPTSKDDEKYFVVDGNRRLTALRLLENPNLAANIYSTVDLQKIKTLSTEYKNRPITELECVVFETKTQADPWIQLIHRGESQGAGLVRWDGQVAARYDDRRGMSDRGARAALQILDEIKYNVGLSLKTREKIGEGKFPITSLTRLINTPYVRKKIGLQIINGILANPNETTKKYLVQIVEDLGTEYRTVSDIKRLDQRINYIDRIFDPRPKAAKEVKSQPTKGTATDSPSSSTTKTKSTDTKSRNTIIPNDYIANVNQTRINNIFLELKSLDIDKYPNAGAVMLRVFIELSLDNYLEQTIKWPEKQIENSTLAQKLSAVANDFESKNIMTARQLAVVKKATSGQTLLVASIKTLHGYVHNKYFSPIPTELRITWDDFGPFIAHIWPI